MSTGPAMSAHDYASPPMTLVLTVLLLIFFFIGFFSVFFCHCFIHTTPFYAYFNRHAPGPTPPNKPPGLDPAILNSFPTFTYKEVNDLRMEKFGLECAICIGEFIGNDVIRLLPKCCHVFHQDCIDMWLEKNKTCPVCRRNLEIVDQPPQMMCGINEDEALEDSVSIDIPDILEERSIGGRGAARVERMEMSDKFPRSYSTGHSIKKRDDLGDDRYTLRLPEHIHARLLMKHSRTASCTTFGGFTRRTDTGNGGFGEISDFAGGYVNRV